MSRVVSYAMLESNLRVAGGYAGTAGRVVCLRTYREQRKVRELLEKAGQAMSKESARSSAFSAYHWAIEIEDRRLEKEALRKFSSFC